MSILPRGIRLHGPHPQPGWGGESHQTGGRLQGPALGGGTDAQLADRFWRILIRWDKFADNYIAFLHYARALITLRAAGLL